MPLVHKSNIPETPVALATMHSPRITEITPEYERTASPKELTQDDIKAELGSKQDVDPRGSEHVRRGFLSFLCFVLALQDSRHYTPGMKWGLTFIVAMGGLVVPLRSGVLFPCLIEIAEDMHTTVSVVNLSIAFGSFSVAIMPLWWSYLAEIYVRRLVYISERSYSGLKME